ncbi:MAG: radical SAM protein [Vampirovibrionales bacterium]|nr:radical SAM protein [Vampirovibrionales bacterium]
MTLASVLESASTAPLSSGIEERPLLPSSDEGRSDRHCRLGVDLNQYPAVIQRQAFPQIISKRNRGLGWPIARALTASTLGQVPNPVMLTHIVTTRCNYLCSFCSFADTLNAKTDDLTVDEIERVYATMGNNLNTIVYSGGETTLNRQLPEIIESAYRNTPVKSVYIISNAWKPNHLVEITHQVLQRCPGLHLTWSLSIEGPRSHNNTERRTHAEGWDAWQNTIDTMEALKAIRQRFGYDQLNVQLCTVCTPDNHHLLPEWYRTVRDDLQPDKWNLNLMRKSVQMGEHAMKSFEERRQSGALEPFEATYLAITERVRHDVVSGRLKFLYNTDFPLDGALKSAVDLLSQEANRNTVMQAKQSFGCKAGSMGAYLSSTGLVSGCEEFAHNPIANKAFGNVRDVDYDFQALWRSPEASAIRCKVGKSSECNGCTLESQRNYPAILVSPQSLVQAAVLGTQLLVKTPTP